MDIGNVGSVSSLMAQANTTQSAQLAVLKTAIDLQASGALQLVQAVAQSTPVNPAHLGQGVDTWA